MKTRSTGPLTIGISLFFFLAGYGVYAGCDQVASLAARSTASIHSALAEPETKPVTPKRIVVLSGAPGAGKGTLGADLQLDLKMTHISTGELLRNERKKGTELGKLADEYMSKGLLIPNGSRAMELFYEKIVEAIETTKGDILFDGFPRTQEEARRLIQIAKTKGYNLEMQLNLEVDLATMTKRLTNRGRADDKPEVIPERWKEYNQKTKPVNDVFADEKKLRSIDARGDAYDVYREAMILLKGQPVSREVWQSRRAPGFISPPQVSAAGGQ